MSGRAVPSLAVAAKDAPIVDRHLKHLRLRGCSTQTIYNRKRTLARLSRAIDVPIIDATPDQLYEWRAGLDLVPTSIANYVSNVKMFYHWAREKEGLKENPALGIPVPRAPQRLPHPISESDLQAALSMAPPPFRWWIVLGAWAGLRCKEIALLRAENVDLAADPPVVRVAHDATKGRSERVVPLSPFAAGELRAAHLPVTGWAWLRADGEPFTPGDVSKLANWHLRAVGVKVPFHSLRHRFGTQAYLVANDIVATKKLMGHASVSSTEIYVAASESALAATVAGIPAPGTRKAS